MITNLHKANSLDTAVRLIERSPNDETFNTIMSLAVKEIFLNHKLVIYQRKTLRLTLVYLVMLLLS